MKPMKLQEFRVGFDHELRTNLAVGVRYVHKQIDRAIEDTGALDAAGNEIYIIANPGEGLTELAFANPTDRVPKAVRDYDSVELGSTSGSRTTGRCAPATCGAVSTATTRACRSRDENGRTSPNVGRLRLPDDDVR